MRTSRSYLSRYPKLIYIQVVFAARMLSWINIFKVIVNVDDHHTQNQLKLTIRGFQEEKAIKSLIHTEKAA